VAASAAFVVPDAVGVVVGWRAWKVALAADGEPRLRAMTRLGCCGGAGGWWPARRPLEAMCPGQRHDAPVAACSCGVHAAASYDVLDELGFVDDTGHAIAVGIVSLWGRVVETERGWRAQSAYPLRMWLPLSIAHLAPGLARAYRVPTFIRNRTGAAIA
jgi:hypothetical protein